MEELPMEPRGLFYQENFVDPAHEAELVRLFREELDWPVRPPGTRLSLHYGYTFDYKTFGVDPDIPFKPFPDWLRPLIPQTVRGGLPPAQVCLQYYPPGAGIPPHVDTHSAYDELYSLSLGSAVMMQFRRPPSIAAVATPSGEATGDAGEEEEDKRAELDLVPRSLLEMRGDSRLHWTHGIKKRKTDTLPDGTVRPRQDRWSITYRWLRERAVDEDTPAECECGNARLCDTAQRRVGIEREYRWKQQEQEKKQEDTGTLREAAS
ncbi:hypothetical protein PG997_001851 [Apiospora hydei]|uniref:Fe2OG dioxygenase domain-containing protein n=1 Tax=Apiospora hydei TaxID=1337664 RepID=A0ABR1X7Z3_9PEZI